jgi:Rrf2 family transcriptional regulator, iron-sulfur cluster assembly transcription factor
VLNQSADHALRAVLFVARNEGTAPCSAELIASSIDVPRNYLGKLLNTLAQVGVLNSTRGPRGGFRLAVAPSALTLAHVVEPFQRLPERRTCLLGNGACDPANPCRSHERWQDMADHLTAFFQVTTIEAMLSGGGGAVNGRANGNGSYPPAGTEASVRTDPPTHSPEKDV